MLVASPMLFNANSARAELGVAVGNGEGTVLLTCSDGSQEEVSEKYPLITRLTLSLQRLLDYKEPVFGREKEIESFS